MIPPRMWVIAGALASLAGPAFGQQPPVAEPSKFLAAYLNPQILDGHGQRAPESNDLIQPIDVNGAIHVQFRHDTMKAFAPLRPAVAGDAAAREVTLALLTDLEAYGLVADSLARAARVGGPEFDAARNRAVDWYSTYTDHVVRYFTWLAAREQPGADTTHAGRQRAQQYMGRDKMPAFVALLQQELQKLFRDAAAATPDYGTLRLAALRITPKGDTIQVKVPGYDSAANRPPTMIRKITTEMTPAEKAAYQYSQEVSTKFKNVGDVAAYASSGIAQIMDDARSALRELVGSLAAADSGAAVTPLTNVLAGAPPGARQAATRVGEDVAAARSWLRGLRASSGTLVLDLNGALEQEDPLLFLGALQEAFHAAPVLRDTLAAGQRLAESLAAHVRALVALVPTLDVAASTAASAPLSRIVAAYGQLQHIVDNAGLLTTYGHNLRRLAGAFSDEAIHRLKLIPQPVATAPESDILLARAGGDRAEGDLLVLHADLVAPDSASVATYEWLYRIEKLGWSSRFAAGVGFAEGLSAASDEPVRPIPVLAWVLRYRTRGQSPGQRLWNFLDPSFGLHTVTLSTDTQAIQLGVGLSLNLLQDFVQLGMGYRFQPAGLGDPYWYFGFGLFKLANLVK